MNFEIPTGILSGSIKSPPSKSLTHRLLIMGALSEKECVIRNPLFCVDTQITLAGLKKLGFEIEATQDAIRFKGSRKDIEIPVEIYVGNSGTSARFLSALAALLPVRCTINGSARMQQRPMLPLISVLKNLGANVESISGYLPLKITGANLSGGMIQIDSSQSSQFLSAILLIAPYLSEDSQIQFGDSIASKPYANMTIALMRKAGIIIEDNRDHYRVASGQAYSFVAETVEGDFSSAANFMVGAAITGGRVEISNLSVDFIQGDKTILEMLKNSGAKVAFEDSRVIIEGDKLSALDWEMRHYPDLVPAVSVLALHARDMSTLRNVANLRLKESDRLKAIIENIDRIGGKAFLNGSDLIIAPQPLHGTLLPTYDDHRIAMSFAMAGLKTAGLVIKNSECVSKSYPDFWDDFERLVK